MKYLDNLFPNLWHLTIFPFMVNAYNAKYKREQLLLLLNTFIFQHLKTRFTTNMSNFTVKMCYNLPQSQHILLCVQPCQFQVEKTMNDVDQIKPNDANNSFSRPVQESCHTCCPYQDERYSNCFPNITFFINYLSKSSERVNEQKKAINKE